METAVAHISSPAERVIHRGRKLSQGYRGELIVCVIVFTYRQSEYIGERKRERGI